LWPALVALPNPLILDRRFRFESGIVSEEIPSDNGGHRHPILLLADGSTLRVDMKRSGYHGERSMMVAHGINPRRFPD
jgi:hypothetical protein